ncbi:hypothetical protein [Chromobacterium alticapitis]|uniref:hypothetical protein n=1 Tax=Chromobacterium alticapitis TaxID=2073169 RepID=UPI001E5A212C|nr:hypothetical protein [Chromobacterium alticapitis]
MMKLEWMVRNAVESDYAGWRPLWDGYNAFYGRAGETALPEADYPANLGALPGRA